MSLVPLVTQALSILVVLSDIVIVVWIVALVMRRRMNVASQFISWLSNHAVVLALIVAFVSMVSSLFYSDIAGYEPCKLCWYQRIFMYSQVFILAIALWRKNREVVEYSIGLSLIGGLIAAYHYYGQITNTPLPCSVIGFSSACSQRFVLTYGYITIPMMALTGFGLILMVMISRKISK